VPTRNVVLTDSQANMIQSLVNSGRYQNASEVVREGLRLIERRELEQAAKLRALQTATEAGIAALESGAFKDFANAAELENYLVAVSNDALAGNVHPR